MAYQIADIIAKTEADPAAFTAECDEAFRLQIASAAEEILQNRAKSPIVLLSGPSASGKTTTAMLLELELERRGIEAHTVSLDNYYRTGGERTAPKTPEGTPDLESPYCLDLPLLAEHFAALTRGERIGVPKFDFETQSRVEGAERPLRLGDREVAVFEGIHALNEEIGGGFPDAYRMFVCAREDVLDGDEVLLTAEETRFLRRMVRDRRYRGASAAYTASLWENVLRGEREYIRPYAHLANFRVNSSFACELPVLRREVEPLILAEPDLPAWVRKYAHTVGRFPEIPETLVAEGSLLREFLGGGVFKYR